MSIPCYDIAFLVNHESCFVNIDILSLFILAEHELNLPRVVPVENSHNFLQFKGLTVVVEEFWHETAKSLELAIVKALDTVLVDDTTLFIDQEALHRDESAKFIYETIASLTLIETQRVFRVFVEEGSKKIERVEVVLF